MGNKDESVSGKNESLISDKKSRNNSTNIKKPKHYDLGTEEEDVNRCEAEFKLQQRLKDVGKLYTILGSIRDEGM